MFVDFNILNQLGSPAINSNTFANRPAAGQTGRLFVSIDTFEIYRDNGTTWDLIGGPGSSTITGTGTATQVAYFTSSQAIGSSANLFWDNTSGFLGVATATPSARIEAVKTDGVGIYANYTTNAGSGSSTTAIWAKNITNSSGFAAVIEETTPNTTAGQYPLLIKHSLSSGTAGVGMGTGIHWQLPDDAGTFKTTQLTIETIDAAAATYATRYRFNVQSNGTGTPVAYINATGLGIFTATPGAALDIHSTGIMAQLNSTSATANSLLAFQRSGSGLWRIGDVYNGGPNYFELYNTVLGINAMQVFAATNKTSWQATENYTSGVARGNYFDYNLTLNPANPLASPNAISAVGASLDLTLEGSITIPSGARSGLDAYNSIRFTTTGTLTHNQGTQIRAYSNLTAGWAFNGSATGTITHLAGLRALFPDNTGSAVTVTNNYALLLNDQTANTGTVTYTNRWGIYQEGASDLNYMAANLLLGSTTNNGAKLQVQGEATINNSINVNDQGRFKGWFTSGTGLAVEVGVSSSVGNVLCYNRTSGSYGELSLAGGDSGGNTQMRFTSTGIGIGTNAPTRLLDVDGVIRTRNSGSAGAPSIELGTSAQGNGLFYPTTNTIAISTNDTERMRITSGGEVLVGSTSSGLSSSGRGVIEINGTSESILGLKVNNVVKTYLYQSGDNVEFNNTANGYLALKTNVSERMRITSVGNVLIGTTTDAGQKLQVNGTTKTTGLIQYNSKGFLISAVNSVVNGTKTVTISNPSTNGFIKIFCGVYGNGTGYQSVAEWICGGYGNSVMNAVEIVRNNSNVNLTISAITSNVGSLTFTITYNSANQADITVGLLVGDQNETAPTITIA